MNGSHVTCILVHVICILVGLSLGFGAGVAIGIGDREKTEQEARDVLLSAGYLLKHMEASLDTQTYLIRVIDTKLNARKFPEIPGNPRKSLEILQLTDFQYKLRAINCK